MGLLEGDLGGDSLESGVACVARKAAVGRGDAVVSHMQEKLSWEEGFCWTVSLEIVAAKPEIAPEDKSRDLIHDYYKEWN